jgi:hypothetical protein
MQEMERLGYRNRLRPLIRLVVSGLTRLPGQQHFRMSFLRCCVPNSDWCRLKMQEVRKQPKIPVTRRNASAVKVPICRRNPIALTSEL